MLSNIEEQFVDIVGPSGWVGSDDTVVWQLDWLGQAGAVPFGVARPVSTEQVSKVVQLCNSLGLEIAVRGGNTGLVAGGVLMESGGIILSMDRMNRVIEADLISGFVEVEAGVVLHNLHEYLTDSGWVFPMHLGSGGSAQIGGLISTNAGGTHAFRYGMMQDLVLGLEVVLPSGEIWNGMRPVQKDNTGYQLRKLFCGAEGTLGIVTRAILKLAHAPKNRETVLLGLSDLDAAVKLAGDFRTELGDFVSALEFFSDVGVEMMLSNIADRSIPLESRCPIYMLVEVSCGTKAVDLQSLVMDFIAVRIEAGIVLDAVCASNESQREALWRIREEQPEGQRLEGAQIKNDISVPPSKLSGFVAEAEKICRKYVSGIRINSFGHLGDGNVHFNLSPPKARSEFDIDRAGLTSEIAALAERFRGSFAAEHGVGRSKVGLLESIRRDPEMRLMKGIQQSVNDSKRLNTSVILRADASACRPK